MRLGVALLGRVGVQGGLGRWRLGRCGRNCDDLWLQIGLTGEGRCWADDVEFEKC